MTLTDRMWQLIELVGGKGLTVKAAAREMEISAETAYEYAAEIRARSGLAMNPKNALLHLYYRHQQLVADTT